jgi:hypothetical protein
MADHLKVVVGVPSGASWNAQFGVDLVNLVATFTQKPVPGYRSQELQVVNVRSSILSKNRLDLVKAARGLAATHLLFIDSDQTFPRNIVHQLARHGKLVVAANIATKQIPATTTARAKSANPKGEIVYTDPESTGLEEVWRVGTGVMLIHMSVFKRIGLGVWDMKYLPEEETYQGEDWTFCEACEKAGIPIFVDHDVSKQIGHIGNYEFTHDVVGNLAGHVEGA